MKTNSESRTQQNLTSKGSKFGSGAIFAILLQIRVNGNGNLQLLDDKVKAKRALLDFNQDCT